MQKSQFLLDTPVARGPILLLTPGDPFSMVTNELCGQALNAVISFHTFLCTGEVCTLCTSQFQNRPSPRAIPGHVTRVKLRTVGNLTQNEARPVGHLTFVSKRLSAVGNKRISQFFDSARAPRSRVIALVDSTWVFLLLSFLYRGICLCLKCGAKTS